jgi:hypothetical protein
VAKATLLRVAAANVGAMKAYRVMAFMVEWNMARESLGQSELTVEEFADWWHVHIRTAYRDQARFRDAFPGESNPDRLLDAALAEWSSREGVSGLASLALPRLAA